MWTVLDAMSEDIVSRETVVHGYPHDWRTKQPLITRASQQWFVDTSKLKRRALVGLIYRLISFIYIFILVDFLSCVYFLL